MTSGRDTLQTIHRAIKDEQARAAEVDRRLEAITQRLARFDVARGEALQALARVRVDQLVAGPSTERVEEADRRVLDMLEQRAASIEVLHASLAALEASRTELEAERDRRADALERASDAVDDAEAATQARLDADPAYREQRDRAHAKRRVAQHADEKASQSERERVEKERDYQRDPLFMYLWRRGHGTPRYRALPLTRWLDGKVARLVRFDGARANYARLQELPARLREHANAVAEQADAEWGRLQELDAAARAQDGIPALEAARDAAREALEAVDARLAGVAEERDTHLARLERVSKGEDEHYLRAVSFLASELGRDELQALRRAALATPYPEDDEIVTRLLDVEVEREAAEASLAELKQVAERTRARVRELEQLRIEFTRRRFDQPGSTFADGAMIAMVLAQFFQGAMTRDALLRVLAQQQRQAPRQSDPLFGSGGFGRGTVWTGGRSSPTGPGRSTGGAIGGAARAAGSAFRTAGRIGGRARGGGFRTGGKF